MKVVVKFHRCILDSQDYGYDDEHMVSKIFLDIEPETGKGWNGHVDVKQIVGSSFETAPLEVGRPEGYGGPFNYSSFRECVEGYYRALVGSRGSAINVTGRAQFRLRNSGIAAEASCEFDVTSDNAGW